MAQKGMKYLTTTIALCMLTGMLIGDVSAQSCCGMGSSLVSTGTPSVFQGTFLVLSSANFSNTQSGDFYQTGGALTIAYGITDWLNISFSNGFNWKQASFLRPGRYDTSVTAEGTIITPIVEDSTLTYENTGIGDGTIGAQFIMIPMNAITKKELKAGFDVVLPWGETDETGIVAGEKNALPAKVQGGSAGSSIGGFVSFSKGLPLAKTTLSASTGGRIRFINDYGDKPGNDLNFLGTGVFGPFGILRGVVSASYARAFETETVVEGGRRIDGQSGGRRVDMMPGIDLSFGESLTFALDCQFPLWRDARQQEYGTYFSARLSALMYLPVF